jgi:hypothetical protein
VVDAPTKVEIHCTPDLQGAFVMDANELDHPIWTRLKLAIRTKKIEHTISDDRIHLSWPDTLTIVRELGSRSNQQSLNFRFLPQGDATLRLKQFAAEVQTFLYQVLERRRLHLHCTCSFGSQIITSL